MSTANAEPRRPGAHLDTATNRPDALARSASRSAGQTCCIADFQVGKALGITQFAGLSRKAGRDTADLEVCATGAVPRCARRPAGVGCSDWLGDFIGVSLLGL